MSLGTVSTVSSRLAGVSTVSSRFSSTDEADYVLLDHQNMISEERLRTEKSLKNVFQRIALFRYDDAKAAVNQAFDSTSKQSGNTTCGSNIIISQLKPVILNLIEKERDYVHSDLRKYRSQLFKNIASLGQNIASASGRNYTPNTVDKLKADLKAIGSRDVMSQNDVTALIRTVAGELEIYVNARFSKLHDQIISEFNRDADAVIKSSFCSESLDNLRIVGEMSTNIRSDCLSPLKSMLIYETSVTEQLFSCSLSLTTWDFTGALLQLHSFNRTYKEFIESYKNRERSLIGKRIIKDDEFPELYKWFYRVYELLLSKYTLFFSKTLFQESSRKVLKSTTTTIIDHRSKLIEFAKKTRASNISLILNISSLDKPFIGHGCKIHIEPHDERALSPDVLSQDSDMCLVRSWEIATRQSYTDRFEVIFNYGKEDKLDEESKLEIVHLYSDVFHKNGKPFLFDIKSNRSYFLLLFDVNIFLSISYNTRKSEKDSEITKFLEDFKNSLSLNKI